MKRWLTIIITLLLSLPFVWGQRGAASEVVASLRDTLALDRAVELTTDGVRTLHLGGDVKRAYTLFRGAIEADSTYAPAHYALSELFMQSSPDSAVIFSRVAYEGDTMNHWYLNRYAQSLISAGRYAESRPLFERLLELRPLDLNAYRVLALLYQSEGLPMKAILLLDSAEMRVGYNPYLMDIKRKLLLSTSQSERAIKEAQAVVDQSPYMAEGRVALAELYGNVGRDSLAMVEYREAMEIDSTRVETLLSMADFQQRKGQNREYLSTLRRIMQSKEVELRNKISLVSEVMSSSALYRQERMMVNSIITALAIAHPNDLEVVKLRVRYLIAIGMMEEALGVAKSHLADDPPQEDYFRYVIDIERYLQRPDSVALYLDRAIERLPESPSFRMERAYSLVGQGRYDESIEMFKSQLIGASDSLQGSIWGAVGDVEHQRMEYQLTKDSLPLTSVPLNKMRKALRQVYKYYDKSLSIYADNALVMNNYAYFLSEYGGDLQRSLQMAERANELVASSSTYIDTYGWVLYRLGRYEEAKVQLRRAISLDTTKNYEIALHFAEILAVLGEDTMANFYWERSRQWGASDEEVEISRSRAEQKRAKQ